MRIFDRVSPGNLENREVQLSLFVAVTVGVLAVGTAVLMYPTVFSHQNTPRSDAAHRLLRLLLALRFAGLVTFGIARPPSAAFAARWPRIAGRCSRRAGRPASNC